MIKTNKLLYLLSFMVAMFMGCEDTKDDEANTPSLTTPSNYSFESRFNTGESSVKYTGQVVRNLLINDIKTQMGTDAGSGNAATLLSMMANDDESRTILTTTTPASMQTTYRSISSSHLNDRLEAVEGITLTGYGHHAGDQIAAWVTSCVADGKTDADGRRLDQLVQKTLWGAVSYWQGTSKYMKNIETDANVMPDDGDPYSDMEHHWDESFGYFGAARDYNTAYTDDTRKNGPPVDSNNDGAIDFTTEFNIGWAVTAAKRDLVSNVTVDYDLTKAVMDAYLEGRTLIHNQAPLAEILAQRDLVVQNWEKVVAAVTIHYVNDVIADMAALFPANPTAGPTDAACADLNNHWGEMRGYANGLLYNSFKQISDADLNTVLTTMGTEPVHPSDGETAFYTYHGLLATTVKNTLQAAYGFSDSHMENW